MWSPIHFNTLSFRVRRFLRYSDSASSSSVVLESDIVLVVLDVVARLAVDVVSTGFWLNDIATELFAVSTENENGFPVDD
jgi:hypothetical protein